MTDPLPTARPVIVCGIRLKPMRIDGATKFVGFAHKASLSVRWDDGGWIGRAVFWGEPPRDPHLTFCTPPQTDAPRASALLSEMIRRADVAMHDRGVTA